MKKTISILAIFIICFCFASCNNFSKDVDLNVIVSTTESVTETSTTNKTITDFVSDTSLENNTTVTDANSVQSSHTSKATLSHSQNTTSSKYLNSVAVPVINSWQPKEFIYYALSDISWQTSENINGLRLYGISVEKYHPGDYSFLITMVNGSDNKYNTGNYKYFSTTYSGKIEKQINGQWVEQIPIENISDDKLNVMNKNYMYNVTVEINHYMPDLENGRYRIILPIFENEEKTGNLTIEFNSTKFNAETARAGTKIEDAISFEIFTPYSGIKYVFNPMKASEKEKITDLYNSFELKESQKPENASSICVKICDSKGKIHDFWVYSDGTIFINNSCFKTPNGQEMYNTLNNILIG